MQPRSLTPVLIGATVLFAIYRRLRGSFGRQRVRPRRMMLRLGILGLIGILLVMGARAEPLALAAALGGALCGAALGWIGIRHTRFEVSAAGSYYTPHAYLGVAVTALFLARVLYRLLALYHAGVLTQVVVPRSGLEVGRTPLTVALVGVVLGYYLLYCEEVLRRTRPVTRRGPLAS